MLHELKSSIVPFVGHPWNAASTSGVADSAGCRAAGRWDGDDDRGLDPAACRARHEVTFDHARRERFRHPANFVRWRPDREARRARSSAHRDDVAKREPLEIEGRELSVSNLDKVSVPASGFRKRDSSTTTARSQPVLITHRAIAPCSRALAGWRRARRWFQANAALPAWMRTHVAPASAGRRLRYCVIDDVPRSSGPRTSARSTASVFKELQQPDAPRAMVFDLDPGPGCGLRDCARAALPLRETLAPLRSFVKTSGVKACTSTCRLDGVAGYPQVKAFARQLAHELATLHGEWLTDRMPRAERVRRVFLDTSQNDPGKQTVAPYSFARDARTARVGALEWDDLNAPLPFTRPHNAMLERVARAAICSRTC